MKKFAIVLSVVVGVWVLSPTPQAHASWWGDLISWFTGHQSKDRGDRASKYKDHKKHKASVPELDPSAAGGAMILLLGGAAYIVSRRRERELG
jgi:hypothetical protein